MAATCNRAVAGFSPVFGFTSKRGKLLD